MAHPWPLTGRDQEMRFVTSAMRPAGRPRGVVVSGAAGVGKTRLVREAVAHAVRHGSRACWVWATASARTIPLGAFEGLLHDLGSDSHHLVSRAAAALTARSPDVVIAIDDAHMLDPLSAHLVHQLAVRGVGTVVATVRSGEPAPAAVTALWKDSHLPHLELQALSAEETERLLHQGLGGSLDSDTASRLWDWTEGNALLLRHLVDLGRRTGHLREADGVWRWRGPMPVSAELAALVADQVGQLPPALGDVLDYLALGEPLALNHLAGLTSPAELEAAEERGLVRIEPSGSGLVCRLGHPLYGEVRRQRLGRLRARRLRGRIVETSPSGETPQADLRRAALAVDSDLVLDPTELAASAWQAVQLFDLPLAERLARAAAAAGAGPQARLAHAMALSWLSRGEEAESILAELLADESGAEPVGGVDRAMVVAARIGNLFWTLGRADDAEALLAAAEGVGPADPGHLLAAMRVALDASLGRPRRALEAGLPLLDAADLSDLAVLMVASGVAASAAVLGRTDDALKAARLGQQAAERSANGAVPRFGLADWTILALRLDGRPGAAEEVAAQARAAGVDVPGPAHLMGLVLLGHAALGSGRVRTAERWLREAWVDLKASRHEFRFRCRVHLVQALAMVGEAAPARHLLTELEAEHHPAYTLLRPEDLLARAWVCAAEGATSEAAAAAVEAAETARSTGADSYEALARQWASAFGDRHQADRLAELARLVATPRAAVAAADAAASAASDPAGVHAASESWEQLGDLLAAADAAGRAAQLFSQQRRRGSATSAAARASRLALLCEGARTPALVAAAQPLPLSGREREVVMLAAGGLSNRDIAERLSLSVRTVEGHLYRIGQRLGVSDRAELGGLVSGDPTRTTGGMR